jgi:hypothetical protein
MYVHRLLVRVMVAFSRLDTESMFDMMKRISACSMETDVDVVTHQ